jgi:hypothetical protein
MPLVFLFVFFVVFMPLTMDCTVQSTVKMQMPFVFLINFFV